MIGKYIGFVRTNAIKLENYCISPSLHDSPFLVLRYKNLQNQVFFRISFY